MWSLERVAMSKSLEVSFWEVKGVWGRSSKRERERGREEGRESGRERDREKQGWLLVLHL